MTRIKRLVAVALAFLMMFSSVAVAASAYDPTAEDSNDVTVRTEMYRTEADGDLVATDKVKKGETVNVKVYAETGYYTNGGTLLFFYNNDFFEGSVSNFKIGSTYSALPTGMTAQINTEDNSQAEKVLVLLGVIDQAFADANNYVLINYSLNQNSQNIKFNGNEVLFEMDIKVKDDVAAGKVGKFFIKDSTVLSTGNTKGKVNIPKGPFGGYSESCYAMDAWNPNFTYPETTVTLFENLVSATFNADGGSINGKSVEIMEGEAGAALTVAEPTKEFNKFNGWLAENATATAAVTAFPSADTTYTAQWESTSTTDKNLAFKTEFYRFDGTDWVQTDRVKRGEEVRLRLFVDTSYYTNAGEIILFYDKDFFINPTSVEPDVSNELTFNTDPASSAAITGANGDYMYTSNDNFVIEDLIENGCITSEFAATHGAYTISYNFKPTTGKMLSNEQWFAEIPMIVSTKASGTGDCFIEENTLLTPTRVGYINIPVSAKDLEDSESQGLWLHNVNFSEESHPVSIDSKITFNANGGAFAEGDPNEYVIEGIIGDAVYADLIPELTKAGSTFLGWAVEGTTEIVDVPEEIPYDDLTLVAQWISKVDITIHPNNGDPDYTLTVTPNEAFEALEVPTLEGNRFLGWTTDETLATITGLPATYPTEADDYYAVFESRVYKVSYYVLDAETDAFTLVCKTGIVYGEEIDSVPSVYTVPAGYELSKAYTDLTFKNEFVEGTKMPANDVSLYYTLKAKTYDATFNANGGVFADGSATKVVPTAYDADIIAPADPVRDGYTFTGWTPAVGMMDAEGKTFTATWDADVYTVEYYKDGVLYEAFDVDYEDSLDVPADPDKEGYEFIGWADVKIAEPTDADIISPEALAAQTMPMNNLQYKAVFEINTYTATFDAGEDANFPNDDDADVRTEAVDVVYGEAVTLPEDPNNPGKTFVPVKEGYTFTGWADENGNAPGKMPAGDTTYTATWQVNKYNLVFIKDADVLVNKQVEFGAPLAAETPDADAVAKEGYTFSGWTSTVADTMPAEDVVYIATYTLNSYEATFNAGEGTFAEAGEDGDNKNETVKTAYGAELKVPALAENEGYVFAGWTDTEGSTTVVDVPATQPAKPLTYYAVWTPATDTPYEIYVYTQGTDGNYGEPTVFAKTGTTGDNAEYVPAPETGFHVSKTETNVLSAPIAADGSTDLIVYYDRDIVTITFAATEADATLTAVEKADYLYGSIVAVPTATRDGYEFAGWALATDDTKTVVAVQTLAETSADYVATWAAKTYTVTYLADGVQVAQDEILCGETITMNTVEPTKTGYTFDKAWTITDENGAQVDYVFGGAMGAENIVLNAKFSPNPYDAVFYKETTDTDDYETVEVNYDAAVTAPATNPTKTGYEFAGWSTNGADVLADLGTMDSTDGKKFYAVWTPAEVDYKVEHYIMDTEGTYSTAPEVEELKALTDSTVTATVKTIKGFTQDMDANLATVTEATVAADGSTVLKVYYERIKYTLTIDRDNGEAAEEVEYYFEEAVDTVTADKPGYNFAEWVDENGNSTEVPAKMPAEDTYIKATWEAASFDVIYMDGDKVHDASSSVYGEDVYLAYADPTKAGYKFAGWEDKNGKKPSDYASMPAEALTFYATWTERTDMAYSTEIYEMDVNGDYQLKSKETKTDGVTNATVTLSYDVPAGFHLDETKANALEGTIPESGMLTLVAYIARNEHVVKTTVDGEVTNDKTYLFGAAIDTIADPVKVGYTFLGWYDENGDKVTIPATMEDKDIIVEAKFEVLSYDLTFEPDNGSAASVSQAAYGSKIAVPEQPTKTGYDFAGWFTADGKQPADYETMPNNALSFTAKWTPSTDTEYKVITYVMNTEGVLEKQSEEVRTGTTGETAKAETVKMDGFYVTTDSVTEETIAADGSTVLVVNYAREQFTVIFDATENGKFADDSQKIEKEYYYGATVVVPADPTKAGYSFGEWKPSVSTKVVADATYTAQWKAYTFTITFNEDGGSDVDDITAETGTAIKAPLTTKDNFKFLGWFEDGATTAYVFDKMPASNVTLTAKWEAVKYTITFDEDGGSAVNDIEATVGTAVSAPAAPVKTGYTFKGWYELDSATEYVFSTMPAANVQLKAKWEAVSYTATFNTGSDAKFPDDTTSKTTEAGYGENVAAPVDPVKEGNTFTGWVDAEGKPMGTMPEGGATYTPTWKVNSYTLIFVKDGEEISRDSVEYGAKIAPYEPAAALAEKTGYTFMGWTGYDDLDTDPAMPAQEVVYYATYEAADFTATFNSGDGTLADGSKTAVVTTAYGEKIAVPAVTAPQGYDFAGWTDTEGSEETVTVPTTQPAEALTYYAVFTPSKDTKYTVEVYTQKTDKTYDKVPFERTGTTGAEVTEKTNPAPGFHVNTQTSVLTGTVAADESTVLKIYYDRDVFEIVFNGAGGVTADNKSVVTESYLYGQTVSVPTFSRTGYEFTGWDKDVVLVATQAATYVAQWKALSYTVTYKANDEVVAEDTFDFGDTVIKTTVVPNLKGHEFSYWYETDEALAYTFGGAMDAKNIVLTAKFAPLGYTASFYKELDDTAAFTTVDEITFGTDIGTPDDEPKKTGYTFGGWSTDGKTPLASLGKMTEEGMSFYAVWVPAEVKYIVEHYKMDATGNYSYAYDTENLKALTGTEVEAVVRDIEHFALDADNADNILTAEVAANGSTVLKVYYERNKYALTINRNNGTEAETNEYYFEQTVPAATDMKKDGHEFSHWVNTETNETVAYPGTLTADLSIKAEWTANAHTLTYNIIEDDGSVTTWHTQSLAYGQPVYVPGNPGKIGYRFGGWLDADGKQPSDYGTMPDKDLVFVAQWAPDENVGYKIYIYEMDVTGAYPDAPTTILTFTDGVVGEERKPSITVPTGFVLNTDKSDIDEGGIIPAPAIGELVLKAYLDRNQWTLTTVVDDDAIEYKYYYQQPVSIADPDVDGTEFLGWFDTADYDNEVAIAPTMPNNDVTVYAKLNVLTYSIKFDAGKGTFKDGTHTSESDLTFGTAIEAPTPDPTLEGFTFGGWAESTAPDVKVEDFGTVGEEDITYVAIWKQSAYSVKFYDYSNSRGPAVSDEKHLYDEAGNLAMGAAIPFPEAPEIANYVFKGWAESENDVENVYASDATMPARDLVLYAVYERVQVMLIPEQSVENCTTVIDRAGLTVDKYDAATSQWYVYGLVVGINETRLHNEFIDVQGDGHAKVTVLNPNFGDKTGTGAIIDVYDDVTGKIVESFRVIIFGDLNGDARVDSTDDSIVSDEILGITSWQYTSSPEYTHYIKKAADLNGDGRVNVTDGSSINSHVLGSARIVQIDGSMKYA